MATNKDGLNETQVKGYVRLFKNGKMIREQLIHRKFGRRKYLEEFMQIAKDSQDGFFEITIQLNI